MLVNTIRSTTKMLRPLVEKHILRGFDIGDELGCPPEEALVADAIHAELVGLQRGVDYYGEFWKEDGPGFLSHASICATH
jgi:hypothetical protein